MRHWAPVSEEKLSAIIADTEQDCPPGNYCAADVYRLAREVEMHRGRLRERAAGEPPFDVRAPDAPLSCQDLEPGEVF